MPELPEVETVRRGVAGTALDRRGRATTTMVLVVTPSLTALSTRTLSTQL